MAPRPPCDLPDWCMGRCETATVPNGVLAAAWEATPIAQDSCAQHIRLSVSGDGGESWEPSRCVMHGLCPLWSPFLYYDPGPPAGAGASYRGLPGQAPPSSAAVSGRLLLFYAESRKYLSPGGDLKLIESFDRGQAWSVPRTLLTHEADGGVPKLLAGALVETRSGAWILPLMRTPPASLRPTPAPGASPDCTSASAGVLVTRDRGRTWRSCGHVRHDEGCSLATCAVVELEARAGFPLESRLVMTLTPDYDGLRSGVSEPTTLQATSTNGGETWGAPALV